jgi:hypothetical protein
MLVSLIFKTPLVKKDHEMELEFQNYAVLMPMKTAVK